MRFTAGEMLCFNSLLDGQAVYGITFDYDKDCDEKIYIQKTLDILREKGILTDTYKLTEKGTITVKLLKEYKMAGAYVSINNTIIALIDDMNGIVINCPVKGSNEQYIMTVLSKNEVIDLISESRPDINSKYRKYKIASKIEFGAQELYEDLVKCAADKILYLKKEKNKQVTAERVYYWNEQQGFYFECMEQLRVEMEPGEIRRTLSEMLEIEEV